MECKPETNEALAFLQRWSSKGNWMLTAIPPDRGKSLTKTFKAGQESEMRQWIDNLQGKMNIYFTVNPTRIAIDSKAKKTDICRMEWLHIDCDARVDETIEEAKARSLKALRAFTPPPTVITDSGGGCQGFWKLAEPVELDGTEAMAEEYEAFNQQLEIQLGGDHCFNVDRIMRLPGTINIPTEKKKAKGRVAVTAKLIEWEDERLYSLDKFTRAARVQTKEAGALGGGERVKISGNLTPIYVEDLIQKAISIPDDAKVVIVQGDDPDNPTRFPSRSEALFYVCCALVRAGADDDTIAGVILNRDNGISASVLESRRPERYAARQIQNAREEAHNPWLRKINEKHAVIGDIGGKCRIISEVVDHGLNRPRISYQTFQDFLNRYMAVKVDLGTDPKGNKLEMPVGKWWIQQPQRRQYETIVFAPGREVSNAYNLWKGFACEAIPGDCSAFINHIRDNVCSGNKEWFDYIMGWMARAVQQPDRPGETAIVMRGNMGTGKSFFAKTFGSLFGRHYLQVSDSKHLVGSFNSHLRDCVVLFGDEAFFAGDKKHESVLKTLITEETITIEAKGVDMISSPNYTHIIMASNNQWVVPAGMRERRFFVLDVSDGRIQDKEYFAAIKKQMDEGGREALLHMLLNYDIKNFEVRNVPKTSALNEQKILSSSPEDQWWFNKLEEGRLLDKHNGWEGEVMKKALQDDYVHAMQRGGVMRRASETTLGIFLKKMCPEGYPKVTRRMAEVSVQGPYGEEVRRMQQTYFYQFPSLEVCRAVWDDKHGGTVHKWLPETDASKQLEIEPPVIPFE